MNALPPSPSPKPVFREVVGEEAWARLGSAVRRHYFLRPDTDDAITVRGRMGEVRHSALATLILPFARIAGALVPYQGRDVPIEVHYRVRGPRIHWDRVFHFPGRAPFHFRSFMVRSGSGEVIEFVRLGIGMRMRVSVENGALVFRGAGYVWRLFGRDWPIPAGLLLGRAEVVEGPCEGPDRFEMAMHLRHPLFGELFRYDGRFELGAEAPASVP
ncbi:DUF4166 domain-containing protein [Aureimonas sp. ME7]|uniref:DUF4166 domain-containing protein n=1 Tax=Aureimonas sp. ME7 TaxID=2744252 RepID=UPI0015F76426|nr:DUF4166 domain-containing protein [Aureimonas sp. ME7]